MWLILLVGCRSVLRYRRYAATINPIRRIFISRYLFMSVSLFQFFSLHIIILINMKSANHISSISTTMSHPRPEHTADLCSNWWPDPSLTDAKSVPGMPHPLCRICANWLPEIEEIGCGNDWPKERNVRLMPTKSSSVPKEKPRQASHQTLSAPRTDPKFQ